MRKFYIFLMMLVFSIVALSQQVPNGNFETWTGNTPNEWDTSNETVLGTTFSTVTKETAAFSGSFAAKVKNDTKYIFPVGNVTLPGILTLGDFVLDVVNQTGYIQGGKPFPYRPYSLKGYYKSSPVGGNTPMIGIGFSKWNSQTNTRDTIGFNVVYFPNTVSTWTEFEIVINWSSSELPDSLNIIIAAADLVNGQSFATNSAIFVDNLYFEYPQDHEIVSVGDFNPLYVPYGTTFNQLPLSDVVSVTLEDNSTEILNVVWQQGLYPANGDIPGEYILEGDLVLIPGISNPNNLKAHISVTILDARNIVSVTDFNPLYVPYGTTFTQLPLSDVVSVTLDDNSTEILNVVWQQGLYPANGDIPGEYILEGDLVLIPGILNPNNLKAHISVTILDARNIVSVTDFNPLYVPYGTTFNQLPLSDVVSVTLDDNSTEILNVVWQQGSYPANGDIPGEYLLHGDLVLIQGISNSNNLKANINVIIMNPVSVLIEDKQQIKVYPNPVNEILYVESDNVLKVELFNISGQKVIDSACMNNKIDLSGYPTGTYILKLYSDDKIFIQKIIKE